MIETNSPQLQEVWDTFLKEWPLTRLRQMKLREYTAAGQDHTFTAWIERRLDKMGSIWGGSSFKFGIFSRKNKTPKPAGDAASYTEDYAWYTKYGASPEEAFAKVRSIVSQVAEAAARGDYASIDAADLGESYKWKIAFQYQDRMNPGVIAAFKPARLKAWLKGRIGTIATRVLSAKGFAVDLQDRGSLYLAREANGNQNAFLLKPDIVVREGTKTWAVIDTKWKVLDPQKANLGVSEGDVYQVLAYAHRYETDLAILVFPHRGALGPAGVQKEFVVHGGRGNTVRVRVATLDLARLESMAGQLEQGLIPEWRDARAG